MYGYMDEWMDGRMDNHTHAHTHTHTHAYTYTACHTHTHTRACADHTHTENAMDGCDGWMRWRRVGAGDMIKEVGRHGNGDRRHGKEKGGGRRHDKGGRATW